MRTAMNTHEIVRAIKGSLHNIPQVAARLDYYELWAIACKVAWVAKQLEADMERRRLAAHKEVRHGAS